MTQERTGKTNFTFIIHTTNSVRLRSSTEIQGDHVKCCVVFTQPDPTTEVSAPCGSYTQHRDTQVPRCAKTSGQHNSDRKHPCWWNERVK